MPPLLRSLLKRIESRALILVIGAAVALWGFFKIAGEMVEGDTEAIDRLILLAFRNPHNHAEPMGTRSFQEAMRDVTAMGGVTVTTLVTVVGVVAFLAHGRRRRAALLAGTVALAEISSELLKRFYARPRPDLVPHGSYVYSASFPSGHSTISAAVFLTLAMLIASVEPNRSTKVLTFVVAFALVLAIGISRIYLGVHWPSDVLAGWSLGAAWALAAWLALLKWIGRENVAGRTPSS
ncbi:MAG: phosphatase PAP2 family protein [Phenylobacterium sp.]|jgi:undecaprenyl-diphosphatase